MQRLRFVYIIYTLRDGKNGLVGLVHWSGLLNHMTSHYWIISLWIIGKVRNAITSQIILTIWKKEFNGNYPISPHKWQTISNKNLSIVNLWNDILGFHIFYFLNTTYFKKLLAKKTHQTTASTKRRQTELTLTTTTQQSIKKCDHS